MKGRATSGEAGPVSLWVRNVQMCIFSIPLAACAVYTQRAPIAANGGALRERIDWKGDQSTRLVDLDTCTKRLPLAVGLSRAYRPRNLGTF